MSIAAALTVKVFGDFRLAQPLLARAATVGDQLLVALANFWLTVAIGRAFGPESLAAYGLGLSAGLIMQGLQRHTISIPLMLQRQSRARRRAGGLIAQHWIFIVAALGLSAIGVLLADRFGLSLYGRLIIAASRVCLLIFAQLEFARAMLIKLGHPVSLLAGSVFYASLSIVLGGAALLRWIELPSLLLCLTLGMIAHAGAVSLKIGRFDPRLGWTLLLANIRRYGGWSLLATGTASGYSHIPLFFLGSLVPPIHAAIFVATRGLMQPLQILLRGLDVADKAAFAERAALARGWGALSHTLRLAGLYALAGCLFGLAISPFADSLVQLAYGAKFEGRGVVLLAWIPIFVLTSCLMPMESLVYARGSFRGYYLARAVGSAVGIGLAPPLILGFNELGALFACTAGALIVVTATLFMLYRDTDR
jgi:O-antigen/teichoic acid export membrane protein